MSDIGGCTEVAELLGVTPGRVRKLCREGRVVGARQLAQGWVIPCPPHILPAKASRRRPGAIDKAFDLPEFLNKRTPKVNP